VQTTAARGFIEERFGKQPVNICSQKIALG